MASEAVGALDAQLLDHLRARIGAEGPLTLARYIEEALLHPRFGYYATRDPLGVRGDFVTSPEISQVFGELVGLWCVDTWRRIGAPDPVMLVELGPGRGTMLADALRAARVAPGFAAAARVHLVERSRPLRAMQARTLEAASPVWHDELASVPPGPLLLFANEFLDALPVRQFVRRAGAWHERRVGIGSDGALSFVLDPMPADLILDAHEGAVREMRPGADGLARTVAHRLAAHGGAALFIDYGYFPSACGDTLQAVRRHRSAEILADPGAADLTAHVDFEAFAATATEAGARAWGPVPQGAFLGALGIEARAHKLIAHADDTQALLIRSGCRRLVDPAEMGTLFKALALTAPSAPPPAGFP
ncbi:MAG TPA: SAM-dependent methyltransferase [Stellaceae bacterium]|nr:SAM-dependent methyltransferase [Stellaceae bacterium]